MYLLSLFVLFLLLGWILATTRFSKKVDEITGKVATTVSRLNYGVRSRGLALFDRNEVDDGFRLWALGLGAPHFPDDFKSWLAGLPEDEARRFHLALSEYSDSLGFRLTELVDGSLDRDPIMRQVFVEAIVVYSPAYRKARQAKKKAAADAERKNNGGDPDKRLAEKSPSRRKQPVAENTEAATAT